MIWESCGLTSRFQKGYMSGTGSPKGFKIPPLGELTIAKGRSNVLRLQLS